MNLKIKYIFFTQQVKVSVEVICRLFNKKSTENYTDFEDSVLMLNIKIQSVLRYVSEISLLINMYSALTSTRTSLLLDYFKGNRGQFSLKHSHYFKDE